MKTYVHLWYLAEFFLESAMFQTKVVEKIKAHFYVQQLLPKIVPFVRRCGKIQYSQTGHRQYTTSHARCVLVTTTTDTHTQSEYVIRIPFPRQQWLRERALMLRYSTLPIFSLPWDQKFTQIITHILTHIFNTVHNCARFWWHKHTQRSAASSYARYGPVRWIFITETR